jgi:hypothetical protein
MGFTVCTGALSMCPFGAAPGSLTFLPASMLMGPSGPMGACTDCIPFLNVSPFGVCMSMANPITAAQTAAAAGVLTPGACIPTPAGTWLPSKPTIVGKTGPTLTNDSTLICSFGGTIKINMPAQSTVTI